MTLRARARLVLAPLALALLPPSVASTSTAREPPVRTVLTIYWSSPSFPGTPALDAVIQDALRSQSDRIDYFAEYLESDRFPNEDATLALRDYIRRKYQGRRIDVVIAITDVALQFVLRYRADLFPDSPVVASTVTPPDATVRASGMTGITYGGGFRETLRLALKLHPSIKRVFYVAEASDRVFRDAMRAEVRAEADRVALTEIDEPSIPSLAAAIKAVPRDSVILYIRYVHDEAGNPIFPAEIAPVVTRAATVPVYGITESYLGSGIVGGMMTSRQVLGTLVAEITLKVLHGTRPQDIPIERPSLVPMFDSRQLRRWGIAEDSLPPNSVVLFRETSIWERYKSAIILTASVLTLQSLLIAGLVVERRRRRRAEIDSRRHLAAMAHLDRRAAMGELATSLAHELNQPLNAILQNAGVAQMLLASNPVPPTLGDLSEIIGDIRKDDVRASEVIRRMRGLLQKHELELRPVDLNELVQETIAIVSPDAHSRQIGLEMELTDGMRPILGDRIHLQQVLLNLVMNAMDAVGTMPAERRRVRVMTTESDSEARLAVTDLGVGIPADRLSRIFEPFYSTKTEGRGMGMGLAIARNIIDAHAGHMAAENNAAGGATVWFSVPAPLGPAPRGPES
jgi:signal transduction histidine kinase